MAKGKKTGGRQKGTPNKSTMVRERELAASGEIPLDYMLRVMRDPEQPPARRDEMAKAAAPYVHPRLQATTLAGEDGGPLRHYIISERPMSEDEWERERASSVV
jgi:hypothetical protein